MSFFGGSKRTQQTTTNTYNTSVGLENVDGPAVIGDGNVVTFTDQGAIDAGIGFAMQAAEFQRDSVAEVLGVASEAIAAGVGFGRMSWEAAGSALSEYKGVTQMGLDTASRALDVAQRGEAGEVSKLAGYAFAAIVAALLLPNLLKAKG